MTRWWPWSRDAVESTRHALIVCGTVLCFVPVLAFEIRPDVWTDDVMLNQPPLRNLLLSSQDFNNVCIACAVMATPSLADAFMDLFVWWRHSGKGGEGELSTKMAHMSISERVLFCTGMLLALIPRAPGLLHSHRIEQWYDDVCSVPLPFLSFDNEDRVRVVQVLRLQRCQRDHVHGAHHVVLGPCQQEGVGRVQGGRHELAHRGGQYPSKCHGVVP